MTVRSLLTLALLASQVHGEKVPLEEVLKRSAVVLIAAEATVATREEKVPLDESRAVDAGAAGTFTRVRRRFLVKEVLFDDARGAALKVGETIEVDDPNWGLWRAMAHTSAINGAMPSPVIEELQGSCFPGKPGPHLLFLRRVGADLTLTVSGAWDKVANRKNVEAALKKR